jgi:hypothetical protein
MPEAKTTTPVATLNPRAPTAVAPSMPLDACMANHNGPLNSRNTASSMPWWRPPPIGLGLSPTQPRTSS